MKEPISLTNSTLWKDLDGRRLDFKGRTFRPRARYVYWSYIEAMLDECYSRGAESANAADIARQEVGKAYWGSVGSYIKRNALLGSVEEMGHEYEHLLEAAMEADEGETEEPLPTGLFCANESTLDKNRTPEEIGAEADEEDDE